MNKRIRLLAEQATTYIEPTSLSGEGWIFDKEKFAHLIVQECIGRCEFVAEMATITNTGEMARKTKATANSCARIIKQHFGVDE